MKILIGQIQLEGQHAFDVFTERFRRNGKQLLFVAEAHGSKVSDARPNCENMLVSRLELFNVLGDLRAWPYQAHIAQKNIPELRQFINLRLPQNSPNPRHSRIPPHRDERSALTSFHRAEFAEMEYTPHPPNTPLPEYHRPPAVDQSGQPGSEKDGAREQSQIIIYLQL